LQKYRKGCFMDITIQVRQRGTLTLPAELRERYGIRQGDTFRLVDLDGLFVLTPMTPMIPELAREIEKPTKPQASRTANRASEAAGVTILICRQTPPRPGFVDADVLFQGGRWPAQRQPVGARMAEIPYRRLLPNR
jgi:bifunctional DNA-binding transcriptional regulator/antitoxin component of YhaV-PrlF toxin-antitoxin module